MGMVGNYMGAALGEGTADVGSMMFKSREQDERDAERAYERSLDRQARVDTAAENRAARAADGAQPMSSEQSDELAAGRLGMTVAEVQAHRNAVKTGDESAFKEEQSMGPEKTDPLGNEFKFTDYPPGVSQQTIAAKRKALYEVLEQYSVGKEYKQLEEGRTVAHTRGLVDRAIETPTDAPKIAEAVAAGTDGKGAFEGTNEVTRNNFTGATTPTAAGTAGIARDDAAADKARAEIKKIEDEIANGTGGKSGAADRLTTIVNSMNATITSLDNGSKGRTPEEKAAWKATRDSYIATRDQAQKLLSERMSTNTAPVVASPTKPGNTPTAPRFRVLGKENP